MRGRRRGARGSVERELAFPVATLLHATERVRFEGVMGGAEGEERRGFVGAGVGRASRVRRAAHPRAREPAARGVSDEEEFGVGAGRGEDVAGARVDLVEDGAEVAAGEGGVPVRGLEGDHADGVEATQALQGLGHARVLGRGGEEAGDDEKWTSAIVAR